MEQITIVGAGTMGHGIAQVAAMAGYAAVLVDTQAPVLEKAVASVRSNLEAGVAKGKVSADLAEATLLRLKTGTDAAAAAAESFLVVEAVPENLELKRNLFAALDAAAPAETLLASNTSSLPIGELARATQRPDRVVGMHFFNPVHIMALLEIVRGDATSDETLSRVRQVGEKLGKTCIVVRDVPGFATSRLGVALGLEAMRMVEAEVASAEDIDLAMTLGYRHPVGPLRLTDLVGLDVRLAIAEHLHTALGSPVFEPPEVLRRKVASGELGKKSGKGFYDWD